MGLASLRGMGYAGGMNDPTHFLRPIPVTAVQYTGDDSLPALEAAFGPATPVWPGAVAVGAHILGRGQWLVRFHDSGEVKVYEPSAFEARFEVAP